MKPPFFLLLMWLPLGLFAQFSDDFNDGSFLDDPAWTGDTDRFTVTAGELQLLDPAPEASNVAYLSAPAPTSTGALTMWDFYVRLEFAPSANNLARIYLSAAGPDLSGPTEGYFLEMGGNEDDLTLFRQDGNDATALLNGTPGAVAGSPALARIRLTRDPQGQWQLSADYSGGDDLQPEGTVTDDTYPAGGFFGFYCRYTTTRSDKFFFDDVLIDPLFTDSEPPQLLAAEATSPTEVRLSFNEPVEAGSAANPANYEIDNGIGPPTSSELLPGDPATVRLTLGSVLLNATEYTVTADNLADTNGNTGGPQTASFTFFNIQPAAPGDLLFNEIMADPTPAVGLPEVEYLELYNRSDKVIRLSDLFYDSGTAPIPLSDYLLQPGAYVILCDEADQSFLVPFGPVVTINGSPGLTNGGDVVTLTDAVGEVIHQVAYEDDWYNDPEREDGGYALELIDPEAPARCGGNWRASLAPAGGTPGAPNSVLGLPGDQSPPNLLSASTPTPGEILLRFDETLDPGAATQAANYQLSVAVNVLEVLLAGADEQVLLILDEQLPARTLIELTVAAGLSDCLGNARPADTTLTLALGEAPAPGDLIFTEIMADPGEATGLPEAEYVELYNPGEKFLELGGLQLSTGGSFRTVPAFLLLPGEYVVLTQAEAAGEFAEPDRILGLTAFPALINGGDDLILQSPAGEPLLALAYDTRWYADETKAGGGWSLELVALDGPPACRHNWRAAEAAAGGTPGRVNSVNGQAPDNAPVDLLAVVPTQADELLLDFSRSLDPAVSTDQAAFALTPALGISSAEVLAPANEQVRLSLSAPIPAGELYTLTVSDPLADCLGNGVGQQDTLTFGLPVPADTSDLAINEVLFFPESGGADFIELYNRSNKVINLREAEIVNTQKESGNVRQTVESDYLLLPGRYAVLTEDPADVQSRYQTGGPTTFLRTDLPTLDSDAGNVTLRLNGVTIDSFDYSDDLHFSLLGDERGVSLERLDPEGPTNSTGNWHSAAATAGFATPGLPNSVFSPAGPVDDSVISIPEKTFSPNGDGFQETLTIFYQTDQPGYVLNLHIFDAQGRPVRQLVNNQSLAAEGSFKWDGADRNGQKARLGIYVLWIELFRPDGARQRFTETCVLAGRLN